MNTQLNTPQPARYPAPTVKAQALTYLIFERPDLDKAASFLTDFGLCEVTRSVDSIYFRGTGTAPFCYRIKKADKARFIGFGLEVASRSDLEALESLGNNTGIEHSKMPGGGELLTLSDPSGFQVEAIWNQKAISPLPHRVPLRWNDAGEVRRVNQFQRSPPLPPEVLRLGHVVLEVADFQATCAWYTRHFGFIPSDVQVLDDGEPAVTFLRLDLGNRPADHHTLALAQGFMPCYSHSAFEVVDPDAVGMGQRVLRERGWRHSWGMGRHILGSQVFDYWEDPWGDKHEHYCDGDVLTSDLHTGIHAVSRDAMSQWGPPMPSSFTKPKLTVSNLRALLHNLRHSPDLTVKKLIKLARLFA